ncbi:MAG TPA: PspC domain-containing protein, partial [Thermoleophilaceae bacterium]|nr:PspC domain-containing protein [Thermoleophilaceae bacterium]
MTTSETSPAVLRRDRAEGWLGGVAAGLARRYGIDVALVRVAFVIATAAGGAGLAAYGLGWLLIPAGDPGPHRVRIRSSRAAMEIAVGTGLLLVAVLLTFRALGVWFSDAIVWPLVLIAAGGALIWRQSMGRTAGPAAPAATPAAEPVPVPVPATAAERAVTEG